MIRQASFAILATLFFSGCATTQPEKESPKPNNSEVVVTDKVYLQPTFTVDNGQASDGVKSRKRHWTVKPKTNLRLTVNEWADKAGYVVYFETDRQVLFENTLDVSVPAENFVAALDVLFRSISLPSRGIHYAVYEDSRTVRIFSKGGA
ncbi:TcpQ domain-containing protein [Thiomicrospira sp.]|uniref:TcpQ domain-containing protein n=1 Tax=Thiomicrospira sp. TaxID=935 RepID=UPI002F929BAA